MKKVRYTAIALVITLLLGSLFSCVGGNGNKIPSPQKRIFYDYFDTVGTFYDYSGLEKAEFEKLADRVEALLSEYHKLYDIYNEYDGVTNLAAINEKAGQGSIKTDRKVIDLLLYAKEMYSLTNGKINVAFGSVLSIWHNYRKEGVAIPSSEELIAANAHTDINKLIVDQNNLTVELLDPEMRLDVGALGKGYAVEMVAKALESEGYSSLVLDVGGNLRAIGAKPNGDGWTAGIKDPQNPYSQTFVYTTVLKNEALVTSGSYERFYTVEGINYHHIINGETLMPENHYLSVSVKSPSSALSDALSTAIFNMTPSEAESFVNQTTDIFVVLVFPSGEMKTLGK